MHSANKTCARNAPPNERKGHAARDRDGGKTRSRTATPQRTLSTLAHRPNTTAATGRPRRSPGWPPALRHDRQTRPTTRRRPTTLTRRPPWPGAECPWAYPPWPTTRKGGESTGARGDITWGKEDDKKHERRRGRDDGTWRGGAEKAPCPRKPHTANGRQRVSNSAQAKTGYRKNKQYVATRGMDTGRAKRHVAQAVRATRNAVATHAGDGR